MEFALKGNVALVTGASRGIGAVIAETLAGQGARVFINYLEQREKAEAVRDRIVGQGGWAELIQADVSKLIDVRRMIDVCREKCGKIEILINNAAIPGPQKKIEEITALEWETTISINLNSVFYLTSSVIPLMKAQNYGRIVNLGSISAELGEMGISAYAASKSGLYGLTKTMALELARHNITANIVSPGYIDAGMSKTHTPDKIREKLLQRIPSRKFGTAEDVAAAILHLVSKSGGYINGQVIKINGGAA
ncbi:MAG: 3-oxoacyl-ACP reductase FabG [Candidatus Wallbacteria bacterium]|nr:3-oxoacyl-ACP reductase FabG [Candidatus Wallbacteria bacterium]